MNEQYKKFIAAKLQKSGYTDIKNVPKSDYLIATTKGGAKVCVCCEYSEFDLFVEDVTALIKAKATFGCNAVLLVTNTSLSAEVKEFASSQKIIIKDNVVFSDGIKTVEEDSSVKLKEKTHKKNRKNSTNKLVFIFVILLLGIIIIQSIGSDNDPSSSMDDLQNDENIISEHDADFEQNTNGSLDNVKKWYEDQTASISQSLIDYSKNIDGLSALNVNSSRFRFGESNDWYDCHYTLGFVCIVDGVTYSGEARAFLKYQDDIVHWFHFEIFSNTGIQSLVEHYDDSYDQIIEEYYKELVGKYN